MSKILTNLFAFEESNLSLIGLLKNHTLKCDENFRTTLVQSVSSSLFLFPVYVEDVQCMELFDPFKYEKRNRGL